MDTYSRSLARSLFFLLISLTVSLHACAAFAESADGAATPGSTFTEVIDTSAAAEGHFWARRWKDLAELAAAESADARTLSLAANSLWQQGKWKEALDMMERVGGYPQGVEPYARLLRVLALERTGRAEEAYSAAVELYRESEKFPIARYYAMAALERMTSDADEKEKWLRRMYSSERANRSALLKGLASIGRMTGADALAMLAVSPQNKIAREIAEKAPDSCEKFYRLGYSAYLRGDNAAAVKWLGRLKLSDPFGESGTYYRAYALQRLGRSPEAEPLLVSLVYKKDTDHMQRAMFRLRLMFGGKAHDAALADLLKMTESENAEIAHHALYSLAMSRWEKASEARDDYLRRYPDGSHADALRWELGRSRYEAGDFSGALEAWKGAKESAQLLYWRAKAHDALGRSETAESERAALAEKYPLSIYSFWANPDGAFEVTDAELPQSFAVPRGELERWGFAAHARMELEGKKDIISCLRRMKIEKWLGNDWQIYRLLNKFVSPFMSGRSLPRWAMVTLYPRPFRKIVEAQSKKYGIDPLFVWATMRHESGYNPGASNWIGANGLMQMMPATAADEAKKMGLKSYSLFNPQDSISMAASHIAGLVKRFGGKLQCVSAAYNAGAGAVGNWNAARGEWDDDMWIESIPFAETNGYVKNVMLNYLIYKKLYGEEYEEKTE